LVKTNRALLNYAGQLGQNDLLPTRLPDEVKSATWLKPKKSHDKASNQLVTGASAAEKEVDRV
jgi:hypothetical protein